MPGNKESLSQLVLLVGGEWTLFEQHASVTRDYILRLPKNIVGLIILKKSHNLWGCLGIGSTSFMLGQYH